MALRLTQIILVYFVIGAVMFGAGAVSFDDTGVTQYFVDVSGNDVEPTQGSGSPDSKLGGVGGAINSLVGQFGGGVVLVWNLVVGFIAFLNWPLVVTIENGVPPRVAVLLGGAPTVMFYGSLIVLVKSSA